MLELKPNSTVSSKFMKVAAQMKDSGYYAVANESTAMISLDKTSSDSFCVILSDSRNFRQRLRVSCEYEIIILTDISDKRRYIIERSGALYLSNYLETDNICEMVKFLLNSQNRNAGLRKYISQLLLHLGFEAHYKGYTYLKALITMIAEDPKLQSKPVMYLYELISKVYGVKGKSVERAIRNAIENAYDLNRKQFKEFSDSFSIKPHNSKFIATMVEHIRVTLM